LRLALFVLLNNPITYKLISELTDTSMPDAPPAEQATGTSTPVPEATGKDARGGPGDGKAQGGGGPAAKKKKKGKK